MAATSMSMSSVQSVKLTAAAPRRARASGRAVRRVTATASAELKMKVEVSNQAPENDLMVRVAKGEETEATPVWLFRQAGRHLPEYNEFKKTSGKNFLDILLDPAAVAEVTMQPLRRYNLDAAILFSDILVIPQAFGIDVEMPGGKGILIPNPIETPADMKRLPENVDLEATLGHVFEAVGRINDSIVAEGHKVPQIGFSAAPWTLFFYMVGGSSKNNGDAGMRWMREHPEDSRIFLDMLTESVIEYLDKQVQCGAHMIQVFEAMGEFIEEKEFHEFAMPCMTKIAKELRARHPTIPLLNFPRDAMYGLSPAQEAGYDVVTLDCSADPATVRAALKAEAQAQSRAPARLQGNFDPQFLVDGSMAQITDETQKMLEAFGPQGLIANLGSGLGGKEDPAKVAHFVDEVHRISKELIARN